MTQQEAINIFKEEVLDKANLIDPFNDECYWDSLALGWALGKGMSIKEAKDFASIVNEIETLD